MLLKKNVYTDVLSNCPLIRSVSFKHVTQYLITILFSMFVFFFQVINILKRPNKTNKCIENFSSQKNFLHILLRFIKSADILTFVLYFFLRKFINQCIISQINKLLIKLKVLP